MERQRWNGKGGIRVVSLLVLILHFSFTLLYVLPLNPVKMKMEETLNNTVGKYFEQNWRLFAPDPVTVTQAVLVSCLSERQWNELVKIGPEAELPEEGWHKVSSALWEGFKQDRLSAYDRLARPWTNAARGFLSGGETNQAWYESCRRGNKESCEIAENTAQLGRLGAANLLRKLSSAYCREVFPGGDVKATAVRMRVVHPVPWSKRFESGFEHETEDYELGVYLIHHSVELPNVYSEVMR